MTPINNATIGIELINDKNWMGGTLYLKNLVMILSQLPASERPKIKLFGSQTMIKELEKEIEHLKALSHFAETNKNE